MAERLRLLLVEDNRDDAELLLRELSCGGYEVIPDRVDTPEAMEEALRREWDLVIADYTMPRFSGRVALELLRQSGSDVPFIFVSGTIGEETAVAAMKSGAQDYVMKGKLARLVPVVDRELREAASRRERRLLEEQLRHSQKMEAVGRLAGGLAHDFNTILSVILSYSDLVLAARGGDEARQERIWQIRKAAQRGAALIRQLLAFSRKQTVAPKVLDLNALIEDMEPMLRRLLGAGVELVVRTDPQLGRIRADSGHIEQVVMNLVVNARDAMPEGGKLTIQTANVWLDRDASRAHLDLEPGRYVMLAISDTGMGMPPEVRTRIFEPFFTTKEPGKGTGLGLSVVYGIVKQSRGGISAESEPGRGTTLHTYFPRLDDPIQM